jgi:hypothetical protein
MKLSTASILASAAFDFGCLVDGVWMYRDPQEYALVLHVQTVLAWDIQSFDAWLFGASHWGGYPRVRQRLIEARRQLSAAWLTPTSSGKQRALDIKNYFRTTRKLSIRLHNLPNDVSDNMLAVAAYKTDAANIKMDVKQIARIQRLYAEMVQSGQKYGAQTKLAKQYGISLATLRKVLQTANSL